MKEKGQALVEFILILPILLLIFISLIDIGNIFIQKYELNNSLETVTELYQNNKETELKAYIANEEINLEKKSSGEITTLTLTKNIKVTAPVLSNILGKNYKIKTERTIYKENTNE